MKRNVYLFLIVFLFIKTTIAQNGIVNYGYVNSLSIGNAIGDDYNSKLFFNEDKSLFVTAKIDFETPEKISEEKFYEDPKGGGMFTSGLVVSPNGNQVLIDRKNDEIKSNFLHGKHIYVKEKLFQLNWKISKEEKKIGNYTCKKATCTFRGRNYIVWFCADLPVPYGPWKLNGLPGLILEAYDTNKNVYWYFKNIEFGENVKVDATKLELFNPSGGVQDKFFTVEEYKQWTDKELEEINDMNTIMNKQQNLDGEYKTLKKLHSFIEVVE